MIFIAKRFLFTDETRTETITIQRHFRNFETALAWIQSTEENAAGGEIIEAETWHTLADISRDGEFCDYRRH